MQLSDIKALDVDTVLTALGLQRKKALSNLGPALGGLVLGAVAGSVSALLFAPQAGAELRQSLRTRFVPLEPVLSNAPHARHSAELNNERLGPSGGF